MTDRRATGELGPYREVQLRQGTVRYREAGSGPPIVFVHAFLTHGDLWRAVAPPLAAEYRCIVPDWPLGAHHPPMRPDADLTFAGLTRLVADFLAALDLEGVTLVGNDTGGALCQFVVGTHPGRIARLVLTNCDTAGNFPPAIVQPLVWGARVPGFVALLATLLRLPVSQRLLFKLVTKRLPERRVMASYLAPFLTDARVRRDARKLLVGIPAAPMREVEARLAGFAGPVLLAWAPEDRLVFPIRHARRLRERFPDARLREVPDSSTLIPEDQPGRLAELIAAFLRETAAAAPETARHA